jgi:hypothetical protein
MMLVLCAIFCLVLADDSNSDNSEQGECSRGPIRTVGMKYITRHAVNTTAPEVGISDVLDVGHSKMLAFGAPNNFFTQQDVLDMRTKCNAEYKLNNGLDFNPTTNPDASCIEAVGICTIRSNGTTIATMYPFKEENAFDIRVLLNTRDTYMNCGGYIEVVYMTLVLYGSTGVIQPPALGAGQKYSPVSNVGCGWALYWLKGSNPHGRYQGQKNVKKHWLGVQRLGNFAPNPYGSNEAKIALPVTDEEGNKGYYFDNQYINFKWTEDGQLQGTRFAQDEFFFPLDTPITADKWTKPEFRQ